MSAVGFVEAFASYQAELVNANWAVSSIAQDGSLVLSCWAHLFKSTEHRRLIYKDNLRRWGTSNPLGRSLLADHLVKARDDKLPVRIVVATARNPAELDAVQDASKIKKTFHVRSDWVGRLAAFDGDNFEIEIGRAP